MQMSTLFKLMPGANAVGMEDVDEPPTPVASKKRKPEAFSNRGSVKGRRQHGSQGQSSQQTWGSEDTSELREVVKKLGNMVLRNAETINRIEYDTCFLLQLSTKPHPGTVIPSMFKVAREWRKMREENPQALQQSLRQVMLLCLVKEVQARASLTLQTPAARKEAERLGFLEGENWVYQTWDPAKKINVRDMTRAPLPVADFNTQAERLQKYVMGSGVTRFQALKQLTPDLEDQQIPFLLDVSLRDSFLHDLLLAWTQLSVFSLVGGRMRRSRIRQGPQQEQMYQMLRNL